MQRRGSYFYVIDAFISGVIIVLTVILLTQYSLVKGETRQNIFVAEDFLLFLESTQIRDSNNQYVKDMVAEGLINQSDDPLLLLIPQLHHRMGSGCTRCSEYLLNITESWVNESIPDVFGVSVAINDTVVFQRWNGTMQNSATKLTAARIVFFSLNETTLYGPAFINVEVWQ